MLVQTANPVRPALPAAHAPSAAVPLLPQARAAPLRPLARTVARPSLSCSSSPVRARACVNARDPQQWRRAPNTCGRLRRVQGQAHLLGRCQTALPARAARRARGAPCCPRPWAGAWCARGTRRRARSSAAGGVSCAEPGACGLAPALAGAEQQGRGARCTAWRVAAAVAGVTRCPKLGLTHTARASPAPARAPLVAPASAPMKYASCFPQLGTAAAPGRGPSCAYGSCKKWCAD